MPRFLKPSKVVVILNGRYAGKKAVIVKNSNPTTCSTFRFCSIVFGDSVAVAVAVVVINGGWDPSTQEARTTREIRTLEEKERGYGHAIVAGVERYPLKITKNMGKKRIAKRSKVKPFIKIVNYNHIMPTRYGLELESLKSAVTLDSFKEPSQREEAKKAIKKLFEERYNSGKNKWFFTKLRF
ncbi:hypothetical protein EC957_001357 [Mortierella hygrophila]|uniref:60S ribosomal protein L27 n=1 Tax=Mortierella hygrophila TaxID=979708 RepID=A0A9P6K2N9_9FUNG|nr:hypothetical protein EC957_001357 [Mortierella hygrophila]